MRLTGLSSISREIEFLTETWSLHCFFFLVSMKIWNIKTSEKLTLKFEQVNLAEIILRWKVRSYVITLRNIVDHNSLVLLLLKAVKLFHSKFVCVHSVKELNFDAYSTQCMCFVSKFAYLFMKEACSSHRSLFNVRQVGRQHSILGDSVVPWKRIDFKYKSSLSLWLSM